MTFFDFLWLIGSGISFFALFTESVKENTKEEFPVVGAVVFCFLTSWSAAIWLYFRNKPKKRKKNCK